MEIIESINMLTWPAAAAIVGSVVTIVLGWFGYMRSTKTVKVEEPDKAQLLHDRVSNLKDEVASLQGDMKAIKVRIDGIDVKVSDHDARDIEDFKRLSDKVEKIMEIIVEMLRDDAN